jgi:phosphatidylglycerophosphatase C
VQLQTAEAVWARIELLAHNNPGGVVATDGDGTLWQGDVGEDFFFAFLDHGRVELPARDAIRRDALEHGLSDAGTGVDVARRIYAAYIDGLFPEERLCELMTWCFAGWRRSEVAAFAREVVDGERLRNRLHGEVLRVLERVRAAGIETVLVSASPVAVVREAGSHVGFDEDHVVAAHPGYDGHVIMPRVDRPIPYAAGKVTRLRERIGRERVLYAAFGDNAFDVAMLSSAYISVAVRPKERLRERAAAVPELVELVPEGGEAEARADSRGRGGRANGI